MTNYAYPGKAFLERRSQLPPDGDYGLKSAVAQRLLSQVEEGGLVIDSYTLLLLMYKVLMNLPNGKLPTTISDQTRLILLRREFPQIARWFGLFRWFIPGPLSQMIARFEAERFMCLPSTGVLNDGLQALVTDHNMPSLQPSMQAFALAFGDAWVTPDGIRRWLKNCRNPTMQHSMESLMGYYLLRYAAEHREADDKSDRRSFYQLYMALVDENY